jgi:hypothetical protein
MIVLSLNPKRRMIDRHAKYRSPGAETELESRIVKKNAIQIPIANRARRKRQRLPPASLSKTSRVKLVFLELFCRGVSDQGSDHKCI